VHASGRPLFDLGAPDRGAGLEHLAEDGDNTALGRAMEQLASAGSVGAAGVFDVPAGAAAKGPADAGHAYVLEVSAIPGDRLSFATMFGMSNDWVFSTVPDGVPLFDGATPRRGDITDQIRIYDVGTEVDQELAIGPDTGPQQAAPNTGAADADARVREVTPAIYPRTAADHLVVTIDPQTPSP
jgi:hypothetical protein